MYENKIEINKPHAPFLCLSTEICLADNVSTYYFDRAPTRSGIAYYCIPVTCCGPPVIYVENPKCFCMDLAPYQGQKIMASPCNLFGAKTYICCGNPCYMAYGMPLLNGIKNGEKFASAMKFAVDSYGKRNNLPAEQMAIFERVEDNMFDFGKAKGLQELQMARQ